MIRVTDQSVRKQMLVMRAAVERVELMRSFDNVRNAAHPSRLLRATAGGLTMGGAGSLALSLLRRTPWLGHLGRLGGVLWAWRHRSAPVDAPRAPSRLGLALRLSALAVLAVPAWRLVASIRRRNRD